MSFSLQEIEQLKNLLLSSEDANKTIALGLIENSPESIPDLKVALCIIAYLTHDARVEIEGAAHDLLVHHLSKEELNKLQDQIIILDYAQYKFKVPEGWSTYLNPLRNFLQLHEDVIASYIPLFKINPLPYAQIYTLLASRIQKEWKNYSKSLFFYEKAIELNPDNTQAQFGFALIVHNYYIKKGRRLEDVDQVLTYYINAYKQPKNINSYKNAAMLCKDIGDLERSTYYYEEGLLRCPNDSSLLNNYANLLMNSIGDYDKAKALAQKGLSISPLDACLLDTMAHIEFKGFQNYKEAEKLFKEALNKDGEHHHSNTGLGDLFLEIGNLPLAESYYLKGLHNGLQYTSREVSEVIEKLQKIVHFYTNHLPNYPRVDYYNQKLTKLKKNI